MNLLQETSDWPSYKKRKYVTKIKLILKSSLVINTELFYTILNYHGNVIQ